MRDVYASVQIPDQDVFVQLRLAVTARVTMLEEMIAANPEWEAGKEMLEQSRQALAATLAGRNFPD